jgi:RNA polymerase sigma-70 factor (ECF subfamily)
MARATLQPSLEPIPTECHSRRVQELADLINDDSVRFHRIARARLGNIADAEDAVQDALLSALTHMDQFRGQAKMSTWLTTIVINSARMKLRRRLMPTRGELDKPIGEQDFTLADTISDTTPGPEETYRKREITEIVARATSRLSPTLHKTFELRDVRGLSIREAASLLGVPSGTIKARTARARNKLKHLVRKSLRHGSLCSASSGKEADNALRRRARSVGDDSLRCGAVIRKPLLDACI